MDIDRQDGTVRLSYGVVIHPGLTHDAFRTEPIYGQASPRAPGNPPWIHYKLPSDVTDGKSLFVTLCFYRQTLVSVELSANLYPPGAKGWESYSDAIEAEAKDFHDRLLEHLFSKRASAESFHAPYLSRDLAILSHPVNWPFPWGTVSSQHDSRGSVTSIIVSYGERLAEAVKDSAAAKQKSPSAKSEFLQFVQGNPAFASGFEAAKLELAPGNKTGAIRLVRETSGMGLAEAQALVATWEKPL